MIKSPWVWIHEKLTTGVHGVGASTLVSAADIATHAALETGIHGLLGEVGFSVHQTSDQTLTKSTNNYLNFHVEQWDVGGYFNLTNERFTPLVAGKYFLVGGCQVRSLADGVDTILMLYKNGAMSHMLSRAKPGGAGNPLISGSAVVDMNGSTDYVNLVIMHYDTVDRDSWGAVGRTWFQGFLIAQT